MSHFYLTSFIYYLANLYKFILLINSISENLLVEYWQKCFNEVQYWTTFKLFNVLNADPSRITKPSSDNLVILLSLSIVFLTVMLIGHSYVITILETNSIYNFQVEKSQTINCYSSVAAASTWYTWHNVCYLREEAEPNWKGSLQSSKLSFVYNECMLDSINKQFQNIYINSSRHDGDKIWRPSDIFSFAFAYSISSLFKS